MAATEADVVDAVEPAVGCDADTTARGGDQRDGPMGGLPPLDESVDCSDTDDAVDSAEPGVGVCNGAGDVPACSCSGGTGRTSGGTAGRARPLPSPVLLFTCADAGAKLLAAKTAANAAGPLVLLPGAVVAP